MSGLLLSVSLVFAFASVVMLVQTGAGLLFAKHDRSSRVNRRLAMFDAGLTREQIYARLTRGGSGGRGALPLDLEAKLRRALRLAGLSISLARFITILVLATAVLWLLGLLVLARGGGGIVPGALMSLLAAALLTALGAWLWLDRQRRARLTKLEQQMPVALDVMTRALRAGHPVIAAVQLAAQEMGDPLGSEFGLVIDETTYGVELQDALANFAERCGSADAYFLAVSVAVQIETGGNLSEIFDGLAGVIRGRINLTQKVRAVSSEGRASALLLTALPAFVVAVQLLFQPRIYMDKVSDPIFWPAVGVTLVLYLVGWLIIRRIINFRY